MDFTQSMDNGYMIPTSVAVGSGEAADIRCVCDTVEDFKAFLDATGMELRYEGLVTYEKVNKLLKVYKGNDTWQTVGEGGESVDTSSFITLTQLSQQLGNYYTKTQTDNKISEEIAKAQLGGGGEVDLSAYATKNYVNEEISKIELKEGPQGPQGLKGETGPQGPKGEQGSIVNQNGGLPLKIWAGTKLEYDSLIVKDEETIYLIDGHVNGGSQTFTITNNLANCTSSNAMQSITSGSSYVATISADEGYKISKVTIMVNNVNVTSDVYSNGIITIFNVTGDIVINVTCVESSVDTPIYELSDVFVLDGTNTIDTGVALFDRDKDFTIFMDFTGDSDSMEYDSRDRYQFSLFRAKQSVAPWIGVDCCIHNFDGTNTQARGEIIANSNRNGYYLGKMSTGVPKESRERQRYIVKRVKSEKKMYFYDNKGLIGSYSDPGDVSLNAFNTKVVIGGYEDDTTRKIKGTVHNFKIWETALTDSEINALFEVI